MPYDFMQCHIQTQNDSDQQLLAPKKLSQKMIKRGFFLKISKLRLNKMHFTPK